MSTQTFLGVLHLEHTLLMVNTSLLIQCIIENHSVNVTIFHEHTIESIIILI